MSFSALTTYIDFNHLPLMVSGKMATVSGTPVIVPGVNQGAVRLEGGESLNLGDLTHTCMGDLSVCDNGLTFAIWLKFTNLTSATNTRFIDIILSPIMKMTWPQHSSTIFYFKFTTNEAFWYLQGPMIFGEWMHLCANWKQNKTMAVYVNGVQTYLQYHNATYSVLYNQPMWVIQSVSDAISIDVDELYFFDTFKDYDFAMYFYEYFI